MENASAAVQAIKSKAASYRKENVKNQFKVHQLTSNDNKHTPKKKKKKEPCIFLKKELEF